LFTKDCTGTLHLLNPAHVYVIPTDPSPFGPTSDGVRIRAEEADHTMNISQIAALAIGLVVFIGLITPGVTRYVLLGGAIVLLANVAIFGRLDGPLLYFLH
jgi:hypothetical protein